jgi:serine protease Do
MSLAHRSEPHRRRRHDAQFLKLVAAFLGALCVLAPAGAIGQATRTPKASDALHALNDAVEALARRVAPSVVQIIVTGYGSAEAGDRKQTSDVVGIRQVIGSGVIVDSGGYILTNAHVVSGAEKIEVIVPTPREQGKPLDPAENSQETSYPAHIVGSTREIDLAVLKIDAHGLPALSINKSNLDPRQGEIVFAFGSPEGLRNTVTMGVVSAVARQPDPDSPLVYIQTDTPINPGNSGGPLVDADGNLVGINTFIFTTSGGNQGLGFAIPSGIVAYAYPQLLKYGHMHQPSIQALLQTITPDLAAGLHLARAFGVIVSDVVPGGPADKADLRVQDIILSVDGKPIESLPLFAHRLYLHKSGEQVQLEVLRGSSKVTLQISLVDQPEKEDSLAGLADPQRNLVRPLSILGIAITFDLARSLPPLRIPMGVVVAARTLGSRTADIPLQIGDVIHAVNGAPVTSLEGLRDLLAAQKPGDAVVLQVERYGQLIYITFSL